MSDRSDVVALEQILAYAAEEARRLRVSGVVLECLRIAVDELARAEAPSPTIVPEDPSRH